MRPRRQRGRLPIGKIDDANPIALLDQRGQGASASDFHVVGVGTNGNDVQRFL
jgi:hypothetical protein